MRRWFASRCLGYKIRSETMNSVFATSLFFERAGKAKRERGFQPGENDKLKIDLDANVGQLAL